LLWRTGTDSSTAADTTTDAGHDTWGLTEQGTFGNQSFNLSSVVYRLSESDSGTFQEASGDSFAASSAVSASESVQGGASNSVSMATVSGQDTATLSATLSDGGQGQDTSADTDAGNSSDTVYMAGSYAGGSFAFASISYQASGSDNTTEVDSSGGSNNSGLSGSDSASSATSDGGGYGPISDSGQQSATQNLSGSVSANDALSDSFSLVATDSFSLSEWGSYANGSFAFGSYVYSTGESATFAAQETQTDSSGGSDGGNHAQTSADTTTSALSGPSGLMTVSDSTGASGSDTSTESVSAADTQTWSEAGTLQQSLYEAGSSAGGSFSFGSVVFSSVATDGVTTQASDSMSGTDSSSGVGSLSAARVGGDGGDNYSDQEDSSVSAQQTGSASDSETDSSAQTVAVYEAGSMAGGSYSLSSYTLLEQGSETVTIAHASADSSSNSGSDTGASAVVDGVTEYSGSSSFSNSDSSAETVAETLTSAFTLSEQGTFAGGGFALASYVFSEQQSTSESVTESDSSTDSFTGTNQGQGYSGGGVGSSSEQDLLGSSGSVSEQGVYSAGSFALGTVTYQGSGSDSFSAGDSGSDSWTGGYSGSDSYSDQSAGNGSYSAFASGSFHAGAYGLSSYVLSGGSSGSSADSSGEQETLSGAGSSWSSTASRQESDSLWQSGATSGGAYSNGSYNYTDSASETTTAQAQGPGYQSSDTWASTASTRETGSGSSGVVAQSALSTYSWQEGSSSQSASSSSSGSPSATLPGSLVVLVVPDGTTVPVAGVAVASGAGPALDESAGAELGSVPSGIDAPVSASPDLSVVGTTGGWLTTEDQLARQAVGQGVSNTASGTTTGGAGGSAAPGRMAPSAARHGSGPAGGPTAAATTSSKKGATGGSQSSGDEYLFDYSNDEFQGSFTGEGITSLPIRESGGDAGLQVDAMMETRARAAAAGRPVPPLTMGDVPVYGLDGNQTAAGAMVQAGQLTMKMNFTVAAGLVAGATVFPLIAIEGASMFAVGGAAVDAFYNAQAASNTFNSAVDGDAKGVVEGMANFGGASAVKWGGKLIGKGAKAAAPKPPKFEFNKGAKAGSAGKWGAKAKGLVGEGGTVYARGKKPDRTGPSKAAINTAKKILKEYERLAKDLGIELSPKRIAELNRLRDAGRISTSDLPGGLLRRFPGELAGLALEQIENLLR